jgi:hypothetical protein
MLEPITLDEVKDDLRLDQEDDAHDLHLDQLITAARRMVELRTNRSFSGDVPTLDGDDRILAKRAISQIVAHWFTNSEAATMDARGTPAELPLSAGWIIQSLRKWDAGE